MIQNTTKERLLEGQVVLGCFVRTPDASFAEYVATGGWDFLVFDGEHGSVNTSEVANLARASENRGVTPMVRVSSSHSATVLRCLDAGAAGLHFPSMNEPEEARLAVSAAKYPPRGLRGLAGNRSTDWAITPEAIGHANDQTLVVVQIETREAVDNIEELCAVDGIDVLFIGPSDLSQSLGVPGDFGHPLLVDAIERVALVVRESEKVLGLFAATAQAAGKGLELGARYVATGVEPLLGGAMRSYVSQVWETVRSHEC